MTLTFEQVCTVSTSSLQICYSRLRRVKSVDFRNKLFMSNRSTCLLFFFKYSSYFIALGLSRRQFFSTGHEIVKKRPGYNGMLSFLKHNMRCIFYNTLYLPYVRHFRCEIFCFCLLSFCQNKSFLSFLSLYTF